MAYPVADLHGDWTPEKWEFWLRERDLTLAVRNLAQHGLMMGCIGSALRFVIAPEHRVLTLEMLDGLQRALQHEWPNSTLEVDFSTPHGSTPVERKQQRRLQAEARAREWVLADPVIAPLVQHFGAQLIDLELKEST